MMQRDRPPELERLDAGAGPARALSALEAEAQAQRVLQQLRRRSKRLRGAWLVAALALLTLGALARLALFEREDTAPATHASEVGPVRAPRGTEAQPTRSAAPSVTQQHAATPSEPAAPRDWLKLANRAREQRDYARARQLYLRAVATSPSSDEAYAANVAAADLEREHLGDARAALQRYTDVLRARPEGPLSEQAYLGLARAYAALGEREREASAWRRLLQEHPGSWFASEARGRLRALEQRTNR